MWERRPGVPWALRLLLLAAVLLGVLTMHTLGHPVGGHGDGHGRGHVQVHQMDESGHGVTADLASPGGMDPMTVCLAVLASWTLVLLAAGHVLRRAGDPAAAVRARLLRAVRALPPPRGGRILLAQLSVLRQ
ncbi:DUF6153 family protein [Kitasatospora aureofaciens]|uniref:DUF6153 family protein n=1 Tax=Kitasatospora aureofaciens TaxID=1894 RepID=UPI001C4536B4|nr:DUF6153 family protein [Kitasatospora aureofaciens]MBV6695839.1 hypothetical protein [Kitasatospora aureofaciens]